MTNPLLAIDGLPAFDAICPEHVAPAVERLLADADAALERAVGPDVPADYDALSAVLDVPSERLKTAWGVVGHLSAVADTPELRAAFNAALPKVTEYTRSVWPSSSATSSLVAGFHSRTRLSSQPVASSSPSPRKAMERTRPRCCVRVETWAPVLRHHSRTESSSLAVARRSPSALNASAQVWSVSTSISRRYSPFTAFHR